MKTSAALPILSNDARTILGEATTEKGAERTLRRLLNVHPAMTLTVWRRCATAREINGGMDGWMYSMSYSWGGLTSMSRS